MVLKFLRQPAPHRLLLVEATVVLLVARLALRALPFRCIAWFLNRPVKQQEIFGADRERTRKEVVWAIRSAFRKLPGETVCFPRGIAAQAMLRRRGIGATLYYGAVTLPEQGLTSHVWVQDGAQGIVGHYTARYYHVLARYPE